MYGNIVIDFIVAIALIVALPLIALAIGAVTSRYAQKRAEALAMPMATVVRYDIASTVPGSIAPS